VELARLNPQGLRAIVLDSAVPAETPLVSESVLRGNEVLARVLAECRTVPSCDAAFPSISEKLERILDRYAATPQRRRLSGGVFVTIDDSQILFLLQSLLSFRAGAEQIPMVIDALDADVSQVDELLQALVAANGAVTDGVYLSVACREIPRGDVDPASLIDPLLSKLAKASHTSAAFGRLCGIWGLAYEGEGEALSSDTPALILTGELDPSLRPEWADRVAAGFGAAQRFVIPGESHTPGDSLCGSRVLETFMESPQQQISEACVAQTRPLQFATP
jgi:pimeloyl-ACP methyl ester carboxylesterase